MRSFRRRCTLQLGSAVCCITRLCLVPSKHLLIQDSSHICAVLPAPSSLQIMLYDNPQLVSTYLAAFQVTSDRQYAGERTVCLVARETCEVSTACLTWPCGHFACRACAHVACWPCGRVAWQTPAAGEGGQPLLVHHAAARQLLSTCRGL